ncbi:hypothetical protein, partial [Xanthomonas perforans]|uniref:hypothetical protein n=1 Tax=Xanthomonas perforans TaxID=442694 RepID=UPI001F372A50
LLGAESALLHVRPLGFTDFIASAGTAQWGQVIPTNLIGRFASRPHVGYLQDIRVCLCLDRGLRRTPEPGGPVRMSPCAKKLGSGYEFDLFERVSINANKYRGAL